MDNSPPNSPPKVDVRKDAGMKRQDNESSISPVNSRFRSKATARKSTGSAAPIHTTAKKVRVLVFVWLFMS